jgi:hypothetical protein
MATSQSTPINRLPRNNFSGGQTNQMPNFANNTMPTNTMPDITNLQNLPPPISAGSLDMTLPTNNPNNLNPPVPTQDNNQLVEDILKEMGNPAVEDSNLNHNVMSYAMDPSQIPPEKQENINFLTANDLEVDNLPNATDEFIESEQMGKSNPPIISYLGLSENSSLTPIVKMVRLPILVFILSFIISLPVFNRYLFSYFPTLLLESGQIGIYGVLLKAVLATILFCILMHLF